MRDFGAVGAHPMEESTEHAPLLNLNLDKDSIIYDTTPAAAAAASVSQNYSGVPFHQTSPLAISPLACTPGTAASYNIVSKSSFAGPGLNLSFEDGAGAAGAAAAAGLFENFFFLRCVCVLEFFGCFFL